jgi:hypothetical protein
MFQGGKRILDIIVSEAIDAVRQFPFVIFSFLLTSDHVDYRKKHRIVDPLTA